MDYQVWLKREYEDGYIKVECGDISAAKREIDKAVRAGQEPILTQEVPYFLGIKVGVAGAEKPRRKTGKQEPETSEEEEPEVEAAEDQTEPD